MITVNEWFGPTIQGEGPSTGRRCGFVRLGRCNQSCVWCDEPQTWAWDRFDQGAELHDMGVDEVVAAVDAMGVDMVVITGGEPLLQQGELEALLQVLKARGMRIEIETAGTIAPAMAHDLVDQWNVSPKLANSGNPLERRYKPDVLRAFESIGRAAFKFVVCEPSELGEVDAIVRECGLTNVWVMPEGTNASALLQRSAALADDVVKRGWSLSPRLHILLWGDRRGV